MKQFGAISLLVQRIVNNNPAKTSSHTCELEQDRLRISLGKHPSTRSMNARSINQGIPETAIPETTDACSIIRQHEAEIARLKAIIESDDRLPLSPIVERDGKYIRLRSAPIIQLREPRY